MLIRLFVLITAAMLIATAIVNAQELQRPVLRAEATVTSGVVRIGDLVENAGIVSNVAVFRAPALGETGSVPVSQVTEALRAHALIGLDTGSFGQISVTRASRAISPQDIEAIVSGALGKEQNLGDAKDITVSFDRALRTIHVEPTVTEPLRLVHLKYDARSGRFDAALEIPGGAAANLRFAGTAMATVEAVTLSRNVQRGQVIKMDDLTMQRVPRSRVNADTITDPDQAIGLTPRNGGSTDRPLRAADLMKPEIVARGANVTISYQVPGVLLAVRGKAAEGGAEGDMIDVLNAQSNRTVRGTITGPGQVAVTSMTPRVIASADTSVRNSPLAGDK